MNKPEKVLYIDYSIGFGGAIKSLALTLRDLPHVEAYILTTQDEGLIRTWLRGYPVWTFRRVMNYRNLGRFRSWMESRISLPVLRWMVLKVLALLDMCVTLKNGLWLCWFLRRHRIQLIHLNNGFTPPEALLAARLTGIPCIVHLRDLHRDRSRASRRAARTVSRVITVSDAVAEGLAGLPISPEKITTVHDPVDIELIERAGAGRERIRQECGIGAEEVAVGIFGRVVRWKGHLEFVQASVAAMRRNPQLRAVIVGDESDGGRDYFERLRATIEESGLAERFVLAGYRENVEEFYAAMDIVVHASISPEPFGMVVPEGMAAGCAVIAADAGGPREVITDGVDGLLVPPGDTPALARAILDLASDPERRLQMGEAGHATVLKRFQIAKNAEGVRAVYRKLLHGGEATDPRRVAAGIQVSSL
jgi:glycosyltransferase involved in cell wall biosynthesis